MRTLSTGWGLAASKARTPSLYPPASVLFPWYTMAMTCLLGTVLVASGSCGYVALLATFAFLAYIVDLSVPFFFFFIFMDNDKITACGHWPQIIQKSSLKRALSEHKVLRIEDPQGSASVLHLFSPLFSLLLPSLLTLSLPVLFPFSSFKLAVQPSELYIALFLADLHVRESRVIGV